MDNVQVSTTSQQLIGLFLSVGVPLLVLLFLALITAVLGTEVAARVRAVPSKLRQYVDQPSDPAILLLDLLADKLTRQDVSPQVLINAINAVFDSIEKQTAKPVTVTLDGVVLSSPTPSQPVTSTVTTTTTVSPTPPDIPAPAGWQAVGVVDVPNRADPAVVGMAYVAPPLEPVTDWRAESPLAPNQDASDYLAAASHYEEPPKPAESATKSEDISQYSPAPDAQTWQIDREHNEP